MTQVKMVSSLLTLLLLIGLTSAMPQAGGGSQEQQEEDVETMIRCWVENWGNEDKITACRDCFKEVGDNPLSETGLPKAKACVQDHLPTEYEGCIKEINALTVGDEDQGKEVIRCMRATLKSSGLQWCLKETTNADVVEHLTDASMCMAKGKRMAMEYVKNETKSSDGKGAGRKEKKLKGKMMKLLLKAHCDLASEGDTSKISACTDCFKTAVKLGKGRDGDKAAMLSGIAQCSTDHLGSMYSSCTTLLTTSEDKEAAHMCFIRVLARAQMKECTDNNSVTVATAETLDSMMDCSKEATIAWVKKNARARLAGIIEKHLRAGDDEMDEDEEDLE